MAEKKIKTRIQQKHDLEANWLKATSFVPMAGELIIYDIEVDASGNTLTLPSGRTSPYTYERFKIGDGKTLVSSLPFATNPHTHDDRYYTETEIDTKLDDKADTTHNHDASYDAKGASANALTEAKIYADNAAAQKSQVQIIIWGADD
jgi:hypothetical protein